MGNNRKISERSVSRNPRFRCRGYPQGKTTNPDMRRRVIDKKKNTTFERDYGGSHHKVLGGEGAFVSRGRRGLVDLVQEKASEKRNMRETSSR